MTGPSEMVSELRGSLLSVHALEAICNLQVPLHATRRREIVVENTPDEGMAELIALFHTRKLVNHVCAPRFVDAF